MSRLPPGTIVEAEHPPHGGRWERLPDGGLRLLGATYPQTETPAEAAHRAARETSAPLEVRPDHVLTDSAAEAAARAEPGAAAPRSAKKKDS